MNGHNLLHRAAFGFPARITSRSGRDITLVFGFFALIRACAPSLDTPPEVIVVFDGHDGAGDRRALLPRYKPPVTGDDEVFADLPRIHDGLDLLGIHWIQNNQWEADDVIASLIAAHPAREHLIMSTDKDFYQLLSHRVSMLNTQRRADRRRIYPAEVYDKHGVLPHQWCDYRALTGDKSDNIPGIRGIGDTTAARLLADGAHLEDLDNSIDSPDAPACSSATSGTTSCCGAPSSSCAPTSPSPPRPTNTAICPRPPTSSANSTYGNNRSPTRGAARTPERGPGRVPGRPQP